MADAHRGKPLEHCNFENSLVNILPAMCVFNRAVSGCDERHTALRDRLLLTVASQAFPS